MLKYQLDSSCVIMSLILMTTRFYKAVIFQGDIWRWSLLGLKGLKLQSHFPKKWLHFSHTPRYITHRGNFMEISSTTKKTSLKDDFKVRNLLSFSNSMTFRDFFHDLSFSCQFQKIENSPCFRVFLTLNSSTDKLWRPPKMRAVCAVQLLLSILHCPSLVICGN